ncbi:MAG: hypothetical protein RJQ00_02730 [Vicingaceae bacterium]
MKKYSLILSELVSPRTKIKVFELCKNDTNLLQQFNAKIEKDGNLTKSLLSAFKIIEHSCNDILLPLTKFRIIKDDKLPCKMYEAKKNEIRIYLFQDPKGRIIVGGGLKGDQQKDIDKIKNIIIDYYNENQKQ